MLVSSGMGCVRQNTPGQRSRPSRSRPWRVAMSASDCAISFKDTFSTTGLLPRPLGRVRATWFSATTWGPFKTPPAAAGGGARRQPVEAVRDGVRGQAGPAHERGQVGLEHPFAGRVREACPELRPALVERPGALDPLLLLEHGPGLLRPLPEPLHP